MEYGITEWREVAGGFSCEPVAYKKDINIKVRDYKLESISREFCNPNGNRVGFEKIKTGPV